MQAVVDVRGAQPVRPECGTFTGEPVQQHVRIAPAAVGDAQRDRRCGPRERRVDQGKAALAAHPSL